MTRRPLRPVPPDGTRTDTEISGLDALEAAGQAKANSRVSRIWSATWPKPRELSDAPWLLATMIVILGLGLVADAAFDAADTAVRRRWGVLDQANT